MTYVIAQPCVDLKDRACVDECPVDCIYEGKRMLYIHPDECVDCGACEPVCPVEAIFYEDDTPEEWKEYYTANVDFFDDLGSPGGAAKMGEIDHDHPFIAGLPAAEPGRLILPEVSSRLPDFPWDQPDDVRRAGPRARRRHRRPVDRHPRRPDPGGRAGRRCARPPTRPGYPLTIGRAETRQACVDWLARRHGVDRARPGRRDPVDRLQGADRRRCRPTSGSARATWSSTRRSRTRRTRSARRWSEPGPSRPTR